MNGFTDGPGLSIAVLPAEEALDFEFYRARLADASVLRWSVAISVFRAPLLAVAVGGPRRGGYFPVSTLALSLVVRDLLAVRPGFPDARLLGSASPDGCHNVEWGARRPRTRDPAVCGRFYGYSKSAIVAQLLQTAAAGAPSPLDSQTWSSA
ncbi:DUF6302 family protein [Streptomyces sp. NPDC058611]|uniref:DUF6302 family protein n=1 Tax=unclassified Streptomyces TaxID=2593676 RepID=UPI003661878D